MKIKPDWKGIWVIMEYKAAKTVMIIKKYSAASKTAQKQESSHISDGQGFVITIFKFLFFRESFTSSTARRTAKPPAINTSVSKSLIRIAKKSLWLEIAKGMKEISAYKINMADTAISIPFLLKKIK